MHTRPELTDGLPAQIQQTIKDNPEWGRSRISKHLCELWDWRMPNGQVKDISCRDMLRALDKAGKIQLPTPKQTPAVNARRKIARKEHDTRIVYSRLEELRPLRIEIVEHGDKSDKLAEFKSLIDQYHYLGYDRTIGENMKYIIRGKDGNPLSCLLFGSAAWKCRDRDTFIGWGHKQRVSGLTMMTNNTRFLIMPYVNVRHLASHILALIARRISEDWEAKYGH